MNLLESFILLALDPIRRRPYNSRLFLRFGAVGISIALMAEQGRLILEDGRVSVSDMSSSGELILDEIRETIGRKTHPRKLGAWISSLARRVRNLDVRLLQCLEDNGIVRIDHERFLGLIPYKRYNVTDPAKREELAQRCREIILTGNRTPEKDDIVLISVAAACEFLPKLFSREEKPLVMGLIRQIKKGEYFETDDDTVKLVVKSIVRAIASTRAAAAAAAG